MSFTTQIRNGARECCSSNKIKELGSYPICYILFQPTLRGLIVMRTRTKGSIKEIISNIYLAARVYKPKSIIGFNCWIGCRNDCYSTRSRICSNCSFADIIRIIFSLYGSIYVLFVWNFKRYIPWSDCYNVSTCCRCLCKVP